MTTAQIIYRAEPVPNLDGNLSIRDCIEAAFEQIIPAAHVEVRVRFTEENDTWTVLLWDPVNERGVHYNCQFGSDDSDLFFNRITSAHPDYYPSVIVPIPF